MKPFFIFALPRTGSVYLMETLLVAGLPVIPRQYEYFSRDKVKQFPPFQYPELASDGTIYFPLRHDRWDDTDANWFAEVDRRAMLLEQATLPYIFKVFPSHIHDAPQLVSFLKKYDCVLLDRKDRFEHFASLAKSIVTGRYSSLTEEVMAQPTALPKSMFDSYAERVEAHQNMRSLFNVAGEMIFYEDFKDDRSFIENRFGVKIPQFEPHAQKNTQDYSWITNADEVRAWIAERGWNG